jgi:Xaa-Pro dipeptidase
MPLDVPAMQAALRDDGLDGWLLYDFHGSNPIAVALTGSDQSGKMTTRRWYYLVPASGEPRALVHAIERSTLDHLPGTKEIYARRAQLENGLAQLLHGCRRVAMEYSPRNAIPYLSRIDAGTFEQVRDLGIDVVPSGDLVQRFQARWDAAALAVHRVASEALYRIKDRAFTAIRERLSTGTVTTETDIQHLMVRWFADEGLISDSAPVVAAQENAGNPHYLPTAAHHRSIGRDELVLLDLWGKVGYPGAVYADITWVGFTGPAPPRAQVEAFATICRARDAAIRLVQDAAAAGRTLRGFEVDRAARQVLTEAGYDAHVLHRTGHSLGTDVHGTGVHMDDYETHDDRRLLPGTGFTIEPGLYFNDFGVRTEVNMYCGERDAVVTGPVQAEIVPIL